MSKGFAHGTADGYNNHKCRCPPCKQAQREYLQARKVPCPNGCGNRIRPEAAKAGKVCNTCTRAAKRQPLEHGTESGYTKGCRCEPCTKAASAARLERKHR